MGAAFFLVAVAINGTVAHIVPLLTDHGISAATAAGIMGIFGLATMVGRLLAGYLVDRIFASFVATVVFLAPIAGLVLLSTASGALPAIMIAFLVSRYMGQRAFGEIYGYCFMIFGLGSSFGKFLGGFVYDVAGSYNPALIGAAVALVVAVILVNLLGAYCYPVHRELEPLLVRQPATP